MLPSICQTISIDHQNKTVTLDSLATILIDRGLRNEEALRLFTTQALQVIKQKDSLISEVLKRESEYTKREREFLDKEKQYLSKLDSLNTKKEQKITRLTELSEELLELEKKNSNKGLYFSMEIGNGYSLDRGDFSFKYRHLFGGLQYVNRKTIYGLKVNPVNDEWFYAGSVSFKIF